MKDLSKVIFCIGNVRAKRNDMRKGVSDRCVYADNDEVIAAPSEQGKTFFVVGDLPFGDMSVYELIRYNRMTVSEDAPVKRELKAFLRRACGRKIRLTGKVRTLSVTEYRAVTVLSRLTKDTATVRLNFDGLNYSQATSRKLSRLVGYLTERYSVEVAVTDNRFITKGSTVKRYLKSGLALCVCLRAESRVLAGKSLIRTFAERRGIAVKPNDVKKIVVAV